MPSGDAVVYLAIVLAVAGIATSALRLRTGDARLARASGLISLGLFLLVTGITLFMYYLFVVADVDYSYVWRYTKTDYPLKYRVSGVLAGMEGSLLFWIWMITIPWAIVELRAIRRRVDPDLLDWTRIATLSIAAVLLYVLSLHDAFSPTPASRLAGWPDGYGLSPLLQTDLMVVHPPVVFIAYGVLVIPFAAAMAGLITGQKGWVAISTLWSRVGWLFLTAGIGIGALWAYVVLGWGGYWGWDPIETSSLLPWLLLTGLLHAQLMYQRKGAYRLAAPLLGVMTFVLVIFATFATRAAGLWVSVHTFGEADPNKPVWDRFRELMETSDTVRVYLVLMVAVIAITVALALRAYMRTPRKAEDRYISLGELIDDDMLMYGTIVLMVLTTVVVLVILLGGVNGLSADNFNTPVGALAVVGLLVLLVCMVWRHLGRRRVALLAGATALAALLGALLFPNDMDIASTLPVLGVALGGAVYKAARSLSLKRLAASLPLASAHLIHVSVVLILLGYAGSNFLLEERTLSLDVGGEAVDFGGYSFRALDYEVTAEERFVVVEVLRDGDVIGTEKPGWILLGDTFRSEVRVLDRALEDVYLIYHNATLVGSDYRVNLEVKVLPLMKALWGGMWLMMFGIVLRAAAEAVSKDRRGRTAGGRGAPARAKGPAARRGRDRRRGRRRGRAAGREKPEGRPWDEGGPEARRAPEGPAEEPVAEEAGEEAGEELEGEGADNEDARLEALLEEELKRI